MATLQTATSLLFILTGLAACGSEPTTEPSPDFTPSRDTALNGIVSYRSVTIPAGVTVLAGDLKLTVRQDLVINGVLRGGCVGLKLLVSGTVTIAGTIDNSCPSPGDPGRDLTIVGEVSWRLTGATIKSSGEILIANDPAAALPSFVLAAPSGRSRQPVAASSWQCQIIGSTVSAEPAGPGRPADSIPTGRTGRAGASRFFACDGSLLLESTTITAGNGGDGGHGVSTTEVPANGGPGAPPGAIVISAQGDLDIRGNLSLNGGSGGNGGNGISTPPNGKPGGSATATGGMGAGLIPAGVDAPMVLEAGGGINQTGSLSILLGRAGSGGNGLATAGNGIPGSPGGAGGSALGMGGNGGDAAQIRVVAGTVLGLNGQVSLSGGGGGPGGNATCLGGLGGPGSGTEDAGVGGRGGEMNCKGGPGGHGLIPGTGAFALGSPGGSGGTARVTGAGNGGNGASHCPAAGAAGGMGGSVHGSGGMGGEGSPVGAKGIFEIVTAGNGGPGGSGAPPGSGGAAGANLSLEPAALLTDSFVPGRSGAGC